jgi:hypothetical protein
LLCVSAEASLRLRGRVADQGVLTALGWAGGDRLTLTAEAGVVTARRDPGGMVTVPERAYLVIPAALRREALEENQVRIRRGETAYLGYQEVHRPGRAVYAQVRMAGVIDEFAPHAPDPDGGRTYRRYMTALLPAPGVLGWGEPAELQSKAAAAVAREWGIPVIAPSAPSYVD